MSAFLEKSRPKFCTLDKSALKSLLMYFYESELCCYFKEIISSGHFKFQLPLSWPLVRYSLDATWLLSVLVIDNNFVLVIDNNFRIVK